MDNLPLLLQNIIIPQFRLSCGALRTSLLCCCVLLQEKVKLLQQEEAQLSEQIEGVQATLEEEESQFRHLQEKLEVRPYVQGLQAPPAAAAGVQLKTAPLCGCRCSARLRT